MKIDQEKNEKRGVKKHRVFKCKKGQLSLTLDTY
jgi:hypothetical protein